MDICDVKMVKLFKNCEASKRRRGKRSVRLLFSLRRGTTLVELMISVLILTIVCVSWLKIIGIQSARKESRRREAVEKLAGMMDAFMYKNREKTSYREESYNIKIVTSNDLNTVDFETIRDVNKVHPMFGEFDKDGVRVSPIGYRLRIVSGKNLSGSSKFGSNWTTEKWLLGELYNYSDCSVDEAGEPFFTLPVCLGL